MTYIVPPKVENRLRENEHEARERWARPEAGCGYQGYEYTRDCPSTEYDLDEITGIGRHIPTIRVKTAGCWLLQDKICYLERGTANQQQVSCKEACPVYQKAAMHLEAGQEPPSSEDAYSRGRMHEIQHDWAAALIAYSKAIELDSNNDAAYVGRGRVHLKIGDARSRLLAKQDFDSAVDIEPQNYLVYMLL